MQNSRVKFKVVFLKNSFDFKKINDKIEEIIKWCNTFENLSLTKSDKENGKYSSGNLSFRFKNNSFIITTSQLKSKSNLSKEDFVFVKSCNLRRKLVSAYGYKIPSSESMLHYSIYKKRKDINAIFHGHFPSKEMEEKFNNFYLINKDKIKIEITKREEEFGTVDLIKTVLEVLKNNNFIIMKNHGFLSLGRNMDEAGNLTIKILKELDNLK